MPNSDQLKKMQTAPGFIAALDQSGGSTPKALKLYGINEDEYSGEAEMFARVHQMRTRIVSNSAFNGTSILGAILFENTLERGFRDKSAAQYLWNEKNIIPFLKVDKGLADVADDVQQMKPMPQLEELLKKAVAAEVFGTKMRSVIHAANPAGIKAVVAQQFEIGTTILEHGLVPIIEPEVDINSADKAAAEEILCSEIQVQLNALDASQKIILKLTLPESTNLYMDFTKHPNCLRVAALSGGYSRAESCKRLSENSAMIASFSRALTEGLSAQQSDAEFTACLSESIATIAAASAK